MTHLIYSKNYLVLQRGIIISPFNKKSLFHSSVNNEYRLRLTKEQKAAIVFSNEIKEFITGMQLGDSSIEMHGKDARLQFRQKDFDLVYHFYEKLKPLGIVGEPKNSPVECKGKMFDSYRMFTLTHPYFTELFNTWYEKVNNKNIKIIPINIGDLLTPIALAYWLTGDGSYDKKGKNVIICTDSFSVIEIEKLQEILKNKFDLISSRVLSGSSPNAYRIRISAKDTFKLQAIVAPYIPNMAKYRIGL